jgi:beta-phosphoglucomutase-like phosphatase (HAD superfamily)
MSDTNTRRYLVIFDCDGVFVDSEPPAKAHRQRQEWLRVHADVRRLAGA